MKILQECGRGFWHLGKGTRSAVADAPRHGVPGRYHSRRAKRNLKAWKKAGVKTVITPCSDCYHTFKRLYTAEAGSEIKVVHMVEFVDRLIKAGKLKLTHPADR